jgi:hypothetical protein
MIKAEAASLRDLPKLPLSSNFHLKKLLYEFVIGGLDRAEVSHRRWAI